ncbi:hypothetical protein BV25DRAFT_1809363 [Artomyces pyxidatus]|uniref:Uncharacterized protein n=1 Tax=Artomyces pyxidatus TaxID=48021 RepID=A0ACB8SRR7_9AGAM|nr:hypothetical protein BV25DRAFT_1809363 [Artomyces pyxidatus]
MASEQAPTGNDAGAQQTFEAHEIRITSHGKIQAWVDFALQFFEANEEKALVFHTLPFKGKAAGDEKKTGISPSTTTIPRLISVVEIVKREYLKMLDAKSMAALVGLYQYNELGCLEDLGDADDDTADSMEARASMLTAALGGSKNVKVTRSPYMKVTLCRKELPGLAEKGATCVQPAAKRTLTKSSKGRLRKRLKTAAAAAKTAAAAAEAAD